MAHKWFESYMTGGC
jgi:hypothetical protein